MILLEGKPPAIALSMAGLMAAETLLDLLLPIMSLVRAANHIDEYLMNNREICDGWPGV